MKRLAKISRARLYYEKLPEEKPTLFFDLKQLAKDAPVQSDTTGDLNVELEAVDTEAFWARFGAELKRRADDEEDEDASHTITEDFSTRGEGSPC